MKILSLLPTVVLRDLNSLSIYLFFSIKLLKLFITFDFVFTATVFILTPNVNLSQISDFSQNTL